MFATTLTKKWKILEWTDRYVTLDKFADMQELFASLHASACKGLTFKNPASCI